LREREEREREREKEREKEKERAREINSLILSSLKCIQPLALLFRNLVPVEKGPEYHKKRKTVAR
jgi:hypothetical protein